MCYPEFAFNFVFFFFIFFLRIFDSHYKVDITGASLLSATISDVSFIFSTLTGILTKIAKACKRTFFFVIGAKISFGILWNTKQEKNNN